MSNSQQTIKAKTSSRSVRNVSEASPVDLRGAHRQVKDGWKLFAEKHGIVVGRKNLFYGGAR